MIKICHITSAHGVEDGRIFCKECISLAKAGYDVYLVERGNSYDKNGVHIVGVGDIPTNRWKRMTEGVQKVYEAALKIDADIYHLHDPELLRIALKLKKLGKKVIFDSHENYVKQTKLKSYLPLHSAKFVAFVLKYYLKYVLDRIDGVIFPCLDMDGSFPVWTNCHQKVTVDNYPLLEELYHNYDDKIDREINSLCYVGTLDKGRSVKEIVEAVYRAKGKLFLAGRFHSEEYKREILGMKESNCVTYFGIVDREKVCDILNKSSIGIATLLKVGQYATGSNLPTKAHEYMAMGLPVILTDIQYNVAFVEKYKCGICVDPTNTKEYADKIIWLFEHPEEAKRMGENGRRAVKEEFNWDTQAVKLLKLYEELAE